MKTFSTALLALTTLAAPLFSETVKDREGAVRKDREQMENDPRWIYNDVARGFTEATRTGKPLLVALRCVPCLSCMGIDQAVLTDPSLGPVLERFVCVRVMNANALELQRFQFDYDLSFSCMIFHGDGTTLARFGSWAHQVDSANSATAAFRATLEAALALHRAYPTTKATFAGKQGRPSPFKTPVDFPALSGKYRTGLDWEGKVVQSCVHCHQIGDALRTWHRDAGRPLPRELIFPMPAPATLGFTLSPEHAARVATVAAGSPAEKAGLLAGDDITAFGGQPIASIADISWVLHHAPDSGELEIRRTGNPTTTKLTLAPGWRLQSDISRRVGTWQMRGMATGGLVLEDLPDDDRTKRGIEKTALALRVKHVGQYGKHAAAKNAGFMKDDILVALGTTTTRKSEGAIIAALLETRKPGEKIPTTVLRGTDRVELNLPLQ